LSQGTPWAALPIYINGCRGQKAIGKIFYQVGATAALFAAVLCGQRRHGC
jgi:hypothetical protein